MPFTDDEIQATGGLPADLLKRLYAVVAEDEEAEILRVLCEAADLPWRCMRCASYSRGRGPCICGEDHARHYISFDEAGRHGTLPPRADLFKHLE